MGGRRAERAVPSFAIPWADLACVDGWAVWPGHPPVQDVLALLPAPPESLWDRPKLSVDLVRSVVAAYAARRGAVGAAASRAVVAREAPVAVVVPDDLASPIEARLVALGAAGVPVVRRPADPRRALAALPSFAARRAAHRVDLGRAHDPAHTAQQVDPAATIGGNPLSSFVVHAEGERDATTVTGEPSEANAMEVRGSGARFGIAETAALESAATEIPGFLDGVRSAFVGHSIAVRWSDGPGSSPRAIGGPVRAWLKALHAVALVDDRIASAPAGGRSACLVDTRARAAAYRKHRQHVLAGEVPPGAPATDAAGGARDAAPLDRAPRLG